MPDLFAPTDLPTPDTPSATAPLADRLRPRTLAEVVGQDHITGPEGAIGRMVAAGRLSSMILWGPPGTGKTTIARLLADAVGLRFVAISAVFSGVADLKKSFAEARDFAKIGKRTLLFVDEIHRFNRAQQDGFLPYVEDGTVTLVGATTENPSFELNAAVLSRAQVLILHRLDHAALGQLLDQGRGGRGPPPPPHLASARRHHRERRWRRPLPAQPGGDVVRGRFARTARSRRAVRLPATPRRGVRQGSRGALQPDQRAAQSGARVGPAGRALLSRADADGGRGTAVSAAPDGADGVARISASPTPMRSCNASPPRMPTISSGQPEGELALAQACLYLATAPKSNAAYTAHRRPRGNRRARRGR